MFEDLEPGCFTQVQSQAIKDNLSGLDLEPGCFTRVQSKGNRSRLLEKIWNRIVLHGYKAENQFNCYDFTIWNLVVLRRYKAREFLL